MHTGPWTACEHKNFLLGLSIYGRGRWAKISKKFVRTRSPTQVASHAQKHEKRMQNMSPRKRKSIFDVDVVKPVPTYPGPQWAERLKSMEIIHRQNQLSCSGQSSFRKWTC
jgi:SHAQKYF class myb-like DNA-binding protein